MQIGGGDWENARASIRRRRLELGFETQEAAAEAAGMSPTTWSNVESGPETEFQARTLDKIEQLLDWHPNTIARLLMGAPMPESGELDVEVLNGRIGALEDELDQLRSLLTETRDIVLRLLAHVGLDQERPAVERR